MRANYSRLLTIKHSSHFFRVSAVNNEVTPLSIVHNQSVPFRIAKNMLRGREKKSLVDGKLCRH